MRLPEDNINYINRRLLDRYGYIFDMPRFRLVYSDDVWENRFSKYTKEGIELIHPEVQLRKKYQHIRDKYVIEQLLEVPKGVETDLIEKISYEPLHTFMDKNGNPLIPIWIACRFLLDNLLDNQRLRKYYVSMRDSTELMKQEEEDELKAIEESLFGDDTKISEDLHHGSGIIVPGNLIN